MTTFAKTVYLDYTQRVGGDWLVIQDRPYCVYMHIPERRLHRTEYMRKYREKNREKLNEYQKERYRKKVGQLVELNS